MSGCILVTGAAGFLGYHLSDKLLDEGHEVFGLDSLYSGQLQNIEKLQSHPRFHFFNADVLNPPEKINSINFDFIFHLACPASPDYFLKDPIYTLTTSFWGTKQILDLAQKNKATFLLASSSEVYGDPLEHPQYESYLGQVSTTSPRSCYMEGKRSAESLTAAYSRKYGLDTRIARIFNSYGPNMSPQDGRVVSNFFIQCLKGNSLTVYGDGTQTRSFCFVSDTIDALCLQMFNKDLSQKILNIGNSEELQIQDLAKKISSVCGAELKLQFCKQKVGDPQRRRPDLKKAKKLLNWQPKVGLEVGLQKTKNYFESVLRLQTLNEDNPMPLQAH